MDIDRRTFIGLGFSSFAACMAERAAFAALPEGYEAASDFNPTPLELAVGATKPFRALHFSDSHLNFYNIPRAPTLELMAFLKEQRTLKAILCGHMHSAFSDRFSETAMQYVVGGNFKGEACEILFT